MKADGHTRDTGWRTELLVVAAIVVLGIVLRVWRLDDRPVSTDEVLTTLVSIGHSYRDVRIGDMWPLADLTALLTPVYGRSWEEIARTLADPAMHHAHPPLFYWVLYEWISRTRPMGQDLVFAIRILPAMFGAVVVALTYGLARTSVSRRAGIVAALLMAVSPLGVYLSQDGRNYTLPTMFVITALWALAAIINRSASGRAPSWTLWIVWAGANALSCYAHYFSWLSVAAQAVALLLLIRAGVLGAHGQVVRQVLVRAGLGLAATTALCVPLGRTLLQDYTRVSLNRSANEWLQPRSLADPIREALAGWAAMFSPVFNERLPAWMLVVVAASLGLVLWAATVAAGGLIQRLRDRSPAVLMLAIFSATVFVELLLIVYGLDKDVFRYPRYHFLYFPAVVILLASGLTAITGLTSERRERRLHLAIVALLATGLTGSVMSARGYGFQDAYYARQVAQQVTSHNVRALTVMGGDSFLTTAMGLSIAREIAAGSSRAAETDWFGYVPWASTTDPNWPGMLTVAGEPPEHVWLIHRPPGARFPATVDVHSAVRGRRLTCTAGPEGVQQSGLEYQRYHCPSR